MVVAERGQDHGSLRLMLVGSSVARCLKRRTSPQLSNHDSQATSKCIEVSPSKLTV